MSNCKIRHSIVTTLSLLGLLTILNGCQGFLPLLKEVQPASEQAIPSALELNKPGRDYICVDQEPNIDSPPTLDPEVLGETKGELPDLCPPGKVPRATVKFGGPPKGPPPRLPGSAGHSPLQQIVPLGLPYCRYGACYAHATSGLYVVALGMYANLTQHSPAVDPYDNGHSVAELALIKGAYPYWSIVEVGWRKRVGDVTRLFVFWWKDGTPKCYNTECQGWVQYSSSVYPGMAISNNTSGIRYVIQRRLDGTNNWWIAWNGKWVGYYPASLWNGQFTQSDEIQFYGEVAAIDTVTTTDMGNGLWSSNSSAARIEYQHYLIDMRGVWAPANTLKISTAPDYYTVTEITPNGMRYGGPGCTSQCY